MSLQSVTIFKVTRFISFVLYIISLTQPCFDTEYAHGRSGEGIAILISGSFGFYGCAAGYTWLANPALWVSWYKQEDKPFRLLIASLFASLISLCFLFAKNMIISEAGGESIITSYRIGYWLWVLSALVMLVGNLWVWLLIRHSADAVAKQH